MSNAAIHVPDEADLLCEGCGYVLNGLPDDARCPECGKPAVESDPALRHLPDWEQPGGSFSVLSRFLRTDAFVLFQPTRFYRTFATRQTRQFSRWFATVHWIFVSLLLGVAAYLHFTWYLMMGNLPAWFEQFDRPVPAVLGLALITYLLLLLTTRLAARLTHWEATYRGYRLPLPVVLRGLDYHAAHYLPAALVGAGTVIGYRILLYRHMADAFSAPFYLYTLCGEVLIAAGYLFWTYWIGMRNMMFANG